MSLMVVLFGLTLISALLVNLPFCSEENCPSLRLLSVLLLLGLGAFFVLSQIIFLVFSGVYLYSRRKVHAGKGNRDDSGVDASITEKEINENDPFFKAIARKSLVHYFSKKELIKVLEFEGKFYLMFQTSGVVGLSKILEINEGFARKIVLEETERSKIFHHLNISDY